MKAVIFNGSPRANGNCNEVIKALLSGFEGKEGWETEVVNLYDMNLNHCQACMTCLETQCCVQDDDIHIIEEKWVGADFVFFASPIYWFHFSGAMKDLFDRMMSFQGKTGNKKIGYFTVGAEVHDHIQFEWIDMIFGRLCNYLNWEKIYSNHRGNTDDPGSIADDKEIMAELSKVADLL